MESAVVESAVTATLAVMVLWAMATGRTGEMPEVPTAAGVAAVPEPIEAIRIFESASLAAGAPPATVTNENAALGSDVSE
ncbi:hypothetical protein DCD76_18525 [Acinetobacter baumannii]|nr:hypothetical protein DCD76_18525 [Acinetobacter baumannii]